MASLAAGAVFRCGSRRRTLTNEDAAASNCEPTILAGLPNPLTPKRMKINRSIHGWILLTLFTFLMGAGSALAAQERARLQEVLQRFPEADLNRDGQLSLQEAKAFRERMRGSSQPVDRKPMRQKSGQRSASSRQASTLQDPVAGYNGLYMGHSFFHPVAHELVNRIPDSTIVAHRAGLVAAGGVNGSPKLLWDDPAKRSDGVQYLAAGGVDLLVMTYHSPETSALKDYQQWIDTALRHNPAITFVLSLPWAGNGYIHQADLEGLDAIDAKMHLFYEKMILPLRQAYPDNRIVYCPYGLGVHELARRVLQDNLPGVQYVLNPDPAERSRSQRKGEQLVKDRMGHGGELVIRLSALIMLAVIYDYDLSKMSPQKIENLPEIDLLDIAKSIYERIQPYNAQPVGA